MRMLWAWCRSHPIVSLSIVLLTGAVASHFIADALAERQWQRYCAAARARGVVLHYDEFRQPAVPDEENFAKLPFFPAASGPVIRVFDVAVGGRNPDVGNPLKSELPDWAKISAHFVKLGWIKETSEQPARDVLLALERLDPPLQQWTDGLRRPHTQFPIDYRNPLMAPMGHLSAFMGATRVFVLRMGARLESGDSAGAYAEWQYARQSAARLNQAPTLLEGLVKQSLCIQMLNAAGFGLAKHQWAAAELARLSEDLEGMNLLEERKVSLSGERAAFNSFFETLRESDKARQAWLATGALSTNQVLSNALVTMIPRRVLRDNQLRQNQWIDEMMARVNPETGEYHADAPTPSDPEQLKGLIGPIYYQLLSMISGSYTSVDKAFLRNHVRVSQMRIGCALERYWRRHGRYPERLAELSPEWLKTVPLDLYTAAPMIYQRTGEGHYLLHSVGADLKDDGGKIDPKTGVIREEDVVWPFALRPAPDAKPKEEAR